MERIVGKIEWLESFNLEKFEKMIKTVNSIITTNDILKVLYSSVFCMLLNSHAPKLEFLSIWVFPVSYLDLGLSFGTSPARID